MGRKVRTGLGDRKVSDSGHLLDLARRAATRAAAHVRDVSRPEAAAWQLKGQSDFVTRVDRETEQLIGEILLAETPDATILGEELTPELQHDGLVWVVDPLDGTTNFLHGYPAYGVSVAAAVDGEIVAGAVADVTRDALYHAGRGGGAWQGERRLEVSTVVEPANALIGTGYPFKALDLMPAYLRQFTAILQRTSGIRRAGAASLDFDPSVVQVDGVQIESGSWLKRQLELANSVDNTAGEVDFAVTQSHPETEKDGSGILARITFVGVADGISALEFSQVELGDDGGSPDLSPLRALPSTCRTARPPLCGRTAQVAAGTGTPVRIRGPSGSTATVCSKCAERLPSTVTTVHLSFNVRISGRPTFTMGSMARVIPGLSCGPRFGLP